jgi:Flp pilus assembly protein TadD
MLDPAEMSVEPFYEAEFLMSERMKTGFDTPALRARAFYGLGHVFAARQQMDSAVVCFGNATQLSPALADAWADLGVALLQLHRYADSDSAMHQALKLQPENFMYWYNYGSLLGATRRMTQAKDAFEKTLRLRPDFLPARRDLNFVNRALGK